MTGPSSRPHRGRRDNGLDAVEFVPVADVDPRVGEHLLDVLGLAGIAAYLAPSADLNPVVRATVLPSRPTDRLWVDREHQDGARDLLTQIGPDEPDPGPIPHDDDDLDVDAEWARIIAGFDETAVEHGRLLPPVNEADERAAPEEGDSASDVPVTTDAADPGGSDDTGHETSVSTSGVLEKSDVDDETVAEPSGVDGPAGRHADATTGWEGLATTIGSPGKGDESDESGRHSAAEESDDHRPVLPRVIAASHLQEAAESSRPADTLSNAVEGDEEEGYTPPPPPPLPRISRHVGLALLAIAGGLLLFFRPDILGVDQNIALVLGVVGILGGFGALVYRLRDGWNDDDPDDGAVV